MMLTVRFLGWWSFPVDVSDTDHCLCTYARSYVCSKPMCMRVGLCSKPMCMHVGLCSKPMCMHVGLCSKRMFMHVSS